MSEPRSKPRSSRELHAGPRFWDAVELEIEELDVRDFIEFIEADEFPHEGSPGFQTRLRLMLRRLIRHRYAH